MKQMSKLNRNFLGYCVFKSNLIGGLYKYNVKLIHNSCKLNSEGVTEIDKSDLKFNLVETKDLIESKNYKNSNHSTSGSSLNINMKGGLSDGGMCLERMKCSKVGRREYHSLITRKYYSSAATENSINKVNFDIKSPIYIELLRILNNSPLDENTQIKIEKFLNNQGELILEAKMNQISDINYYKLNPYLLDVLKKSIDELDKLINNYRINNSKVKQKNKDESLEYLLISRLSNDIIISHLLGRVLKIISNTNLLNKNTNSTDVALDLAKSLLYYFYKIEYQEYLKKENLSYKDYSLSTFINSNYSEFNNNINDRKLLFFGLRLLYLLEEVKLIYSNIHFSDKDHKNLIYVANDELLEKIGKSFDLLNLSYKIPMIVPPKPFYKDLKTGKINLGGYLLNDREFVYSLIIENPELKEQSIIDDNNKLFNTVNRLSSVSFKINTEVLEFILEKGVDYNLFTDPNFIHPLEIKLKNKKKLTLLESATLKTFLSKKQLEMNILGLALTFKNVPEFYIPVRFDNRGRIYCMVDYLNYQSIELAKSLLLFSKGEHIKKCDNSSVDYLKIFGANCYGNGIDKKSYNDRVNWVNNNEEDILNFKNGKLIEKADSKLLFIAFCFEYINYHNSLLSNEVSYISYFPIQLDATCNGYQHLSLLTGDEPLASHVNLTSGDYDSLPKDFYSYIGLKINDYLSKELLDLENRFNLYYSEKEPKFYYKDKNYIKIIRSIRACKRLLNLKINRILVKLPIMVKIYNASIFQMVNYFKEHFNTTILNKDEDIDGEFFDEMERFTDNGIDTDIVDGINIDTDNLTDIDIDTDIVTEISKDTDTRLKNKKRTKIIYIAKSDDKVKLTSFDLYFFIGIMNKVIYNEFPKLKEFSIYLEEIAKICVSLNIPIT